VLELHGLEKSYGEVRALAGVDLAAEPGKIVGFLGPNGAGKTTAMRSVFGLVRLDAGTVAWRGREVDSDARLRFGYMPEQRGLYPSMRLGDQLGYFGRLHGMAKSEALAAAEILLREFGLLERIGDKLETLSHGNQQRVQLATALVHSPELLVLDEPFSGLDPIGVSSMEGVLRERADAGAAVVFSSHQLDLVENLCDEVVIINNGRLALAGTLAELRASAHHRRLDLSIEGGDWQPDIPGVVITASVDGTHRLSVPVDVDLEKVLASASRAGRVTSFTFEPPSLSTLFREAVGIDETLEVRV
jgi:ABC-2 type transport system ATP-binding protein